MADYPHVGPQTPPETRHPPDPLALPALSYKLLRPNEHWKCKIRRVREESTYHWRPVQCLPVHFLRHLRPLRTSYQRPIKETPT